MKRWLRWIPIWIISALLGWNLGKVIWPQYQRDLIPMPSIIHEFGKFPLLDELDLMTCMTAPMVVMYDKEGEVKSIQTYIFDKDGDVKGYYSAFNKGNFDKGYMYGCDDWGEPIKVWKE